LARGYLDNAPDLRARFLRELAEAEWRIAALRGEDPERHAVAIAGLTRRTVNLRRALRSSGCGASSGWSEYLHAHCRGYPDI
jgi:hypothetical protein